MKRLFEALDRFEDSPHAAILGVAVLFALSILPLMLPELGAGGAQ